MQHFMSASGVHMDNSFFFETYKWAKKWIVYPWQAFLAKSNVLGLGQEPAQERSIWKVFHSCRLRPNSQTLD